MRLKLFLVPALLVFLLSACNKDDDLSSVETAESISHTTLVYMVADNSLHSYASEDIDEMIAGYAKVDDPDNNNLLVYIDDYSTPRLLRIKKEGTGVVADTLYSYAEQNSLNIDIMSAVINQALAGFEADSYGLVLWSHGNGWLPGTSQEEEVSTRAFGEDLDNNSQADGTQMDILDLRSALEACPKFEYLLFDACDMQGIEVAYELRNCANYFISSPGEIPAYGAAYDDVVPAFFSETNVAEAVAQAYFDDYGNNYSYGTTTTDNSTSNFSGNTGGVGGFTGGTSSSSEYSYGIAISVINGSELETLASVTKSILSEYIPYGTTVTTSGIKSYDDNYYDFYYDLDGFVKSLTSEDGNYQIWKEAYDNAVPLFLTTGYTYSSYANNGEGGMSSMTGATGVSTYIPANANFSEAYYWSFYSKFPQYTSAVASYQTGYNDYYQTFAWYMAAGWDVAGW